MLHIVGSPVLEQAQTVRLIAALYREIWNRIFTRPVRWREINQAIAQGGVGSLPVVTVCTTAAGVMITGEIAWHMNEALHTISMIPGFTGQFTLRELGVAIPAFLFVSKVGASTTAEVGTMKITEQLDALKLLGIDAVDYLVVPRFIGSMISLACLTLFAICLTLACSLTVAVTRFGFSGLEYLNALKHFVGISDLLMALSKGIVFGGMIPVIACAYGLRCKGGAEGVGNATTHAVVASTLVVIVADFVLTFLFSLLFH
jgi:phospholipid/cholesterol/gamma-HCH transport system permease protein